MVKGVSPLPTWFHIIDFLCTYVCIMYACMHVCMYACMYIMPWKMFNFAMFEEI